MKLVLARVGQGLVGDVVRLLENIETQYIVTFCIEYKIDQLDIGAQADIFIVTVFDHFQYLTKVEGRLLFGQVLVLLAFFFERACIIGVENGESVF